MMGHCKNFGNDDLFGDLIELWREVSVDHFQFFAWFNKFNIDHYYRTIPISDRLLLLGIPVCGHKLFRKGYRVIAWLRVLGFRWCSV